MPLIFTNQGKVNNMETNDFIIVFTSIRALNKCSEGCAYNVKTSTLTWESHSIFAVNEAMSPLLFWHMLTTQAT